MIETSCCLARDRNTWVYETKAHKLTQNQLRYRKTWSYLVCLPGRCEQLEAAQQAEVKARKQTHDDVRQLETALQSATAQQQSESNAHRQLQRQLKQAEQELQAALQERQDAPEGAEEYKQQIKALERRCARLEGRLAAELNTTQEVCLFCTLNGSCVGSLSHDHCSAHASDQGC